jgi:hypothetical protein
MPMSLHQMSDQRKSIRIDCYEPVSIRVNEYTHAGILLNVSPGGFFVMTDVCGVLGQWVDIRYGPLHQRHMIYVAAKIVRTEDFGLGMARRERGAHSGVATIGGLAGQRVADDLLLAM